MTTGALPLGESAVVGLFDAKTHLSELVARVEAGETITVTRHGRPVARLVPVHAASASSLHARSARVRALLAGSEFTTTPDQIDEFKRSGRL